MDEQRAASHISIRRGALDSFRVDESEIHGVIALAEVREFIRITETIACVSNGSPWLLPVCPAPEATEQGVTSNGSLEKKGMRAIEARKEQRIRVNRTLKISVITRFGEECARHATIGSRFEEANGIVGIGRAPAEVHLPRAKDGLSGDSIMVQKAAFRAPFRLEWDTVCWSFRQIDPNTRQGGVVEYPATQIGAENRKPRDQ